MVGLRKVLLAAAAIVGMAQGAQAFELGVIGFQFSSETHARVANAAAAAAKAKASPAANCTGVEVVGAKSHGHASSGVASGGAKRRCGRGSS